MTTVHCLRFGENNVHRTQVTDATTAPSGARALELSMDAKHQLSKPLEKFASPT